MSQETVDVNVTKPKSAKSSKKTKKPTKTKTRTRRSDVFPASSFEDALTVPTAIQKLGSGQKVRRLIVFDHLNKSPESGSSRQMVTNASKYGLLKGNYKSEFLELTPAGSIVTSNDAVPAIRIKAQFDLAIIGIPVFKFLYESQVGARLWASAVLEDSVLDQGVPKNQAKECVETFIVNAKFVGVLRTVAGAERIIPIEQVIEGLPSASKNDEVSTGTSSSISKVTQLVERDTVEIGPEDWDNLCFYISTIGEEGSEKRNHSDLFLGSIVEPALEEFKLKVVRADRIGKPGMITRQVVEHILRSRLVVADLSYHNPNVFYELSLRHACRLPTVQLIRRCDAIPFDLDQFRTVMIDTTDIFTLVPNLQSYKAEIATQVRAALKDPDSVDNPLSTYYPNLRVSY